MTQSQYGVHWFRRDLRVAGNPALHWSQKEHRGKVVGVFFFDPKFLSRHDFSYNRFGFFLDTLKELKKELVSLGSDLLVLDRGPLEGFEYLFGELKKNGLSLPKTCSFNRDYEPFALERDQRIVQFLKTQTGITVHTERDHLLIEPEEITKKDGSYYKVFTPYARKWFDTLKDSETQNRISVQREGLKYLHTLSQGKETEGLFQLTWKNIFQKIPVLQDQLDIYIRENRKKITITLPKAGSLAALAQARRFKSKIETYGEQRDFPARDGTSQMSIYLKNGSFTSAQLIAELGLEKEHLKNNSSPSQYLREIVWREFYYQILFHCPRVENEAFIEKYKKIRWENREDFFEAWKQGRTGYPIVDAGMRQLNTTGWMHNRVRMIVASFLTKDLLINWQWGENHFMKMLIDGDLAPNNGGWQWAASTGCDPQPYFRIFNPVLQSKKFDPEGDYIRRYIPELRNLDKRKIHLPQNPIIDHASRKTKALLLYTQAK